MKTTTTAVFFSPKIQKENERHNADAREFVAQMWREMMKARATNTKENPKP